MSDRLMQGRGHLLGEETTQPPTPNTLARSVNSSSLSRLDSTRVFALGAFLLVNRQISCRNRAGSRQNLSPSLSIFWLFLCEEQLRGWLA